MWAVAPEAFTTTQFWARSRRGRCATARLSSPEASAWLRTLPFACLHPSFLRASAAVQAALALNKPGERSRKRRKAQKMNHRFELSMRRIA